MSYVRQAYAKRKFGRKSTTSADMSYDLLNFDVTARILAVYCKLTNFNLLLSVS